MLKNIKKHLCIFNNIDSYIFLGGEYMNCIIPFTKDIKFKTNIGEILSVSLEHEYTANNNEILGNFIITGEYKSHEVSVNKDKFEYVLPFSVDVSTRIDTDSVDFAVEDFTYEVVDNDILRVNIEYSINALELPKEELEEENEVSLETLLDEIDERKEETEPVLDEVIEPKEEIEVEEEKEVIEEKKEEILEKDDRDDKAEETIIDSIGDKEDVYVTYNIHIMQETDTIETICAKYNTSKNILEEYNDLNSIAVGDKIVIPEIDE